ncbi:MAG: IS110 family transposase, partial [Bacteroidetes bacterium]
VILTEIDRMDRFESLDKLCHYVGLVPNVYASDEKERVGHQTRRGNSLLRRLLLQSAWVAKNRDPALLLKFNELTTRMNANKAIVRIQKKLLSRIRRVMLTGEPYQCGIVQ